MKNQKGFLLLLIAFLSIVVGLMVMPFLPYILVAIILAFILHPVQKQLRENTGKSVSAFLLMVFAILAAVLPVVITGLAVMDDARDIVSGVNQTDVINITHIEKNLYEVTGQQVEIEKGLESMVKQLTSSTLGNVPQFVGLLSDITIGLSIMLFLLYYLLKDGQGLVRWIRDVIPMSNDIQDTLERRLNMTTWAVIKGHVLVAIVQGLVAGIGLAVAGVPNPVFWTFIMVLLGFIPILGTFLVWGPAALYLIAIDETAAGIFLAIYGIIVVGITDNILRPLLVDRKSDLHPAVIILGVVGGVYLFGVPGLFIGPVILGVFKAALVVFKNNYKDL